MKIENLSHSLFAPLPVDLLVAYNKVKRFRINTVKQLKAGVVINVRAPLTFNNLLIFVYKLSGYPVKATHGGLKFLKVHELGEAYKYSAEKYANIGHCTKKALKENIVIGEYVSTLILDNASFQYNAKVIEFLKLLEDADRFHQHCIINNKPVTPDECDRWNDSVLFERGYNAYHFGN